IDGRSYANRAPRCASWCRRCTATSTPSGSTASSSVTARRSATGSETATSSTPIWGLSRGVSHTPARGPFHGRLTDHSPVHRYRAWAALDARHQLSASVADWLFPLLPCAERVGRQPAHRAPDDPQRPHGVRRLLHRWSFVVVGAGQPGGAASRSARVRRVG